jgi:hypothetical protein
MGMTGRADRFVWLAAKLHFVPLFQGNDAIVASRMVLK